MWAAHQIVGWSEIFLVLVFFSFVFFMLGCFAAFSHWIAPKVLDDWAKEHGHKILQKRDVGPFKRLSVNARSTHVLYEIVVLDRWGVTRSGLVKIGWDWWPKLTSENCPIKVYWDDGKDDDDWANP